MFEVPLRFRSCVRTAWEKWKRILERFKNTRYPKKNYALSSISWTTNTQRLSRFICLTPYIDRAFAFEPQLPLSSRAPWKKACTLLCHVSLCYCCATHRIWKFRDILKVRASKPATNPSWLGSCRCISMTGWHNKKKKQEALNFHFKAQLSHPWNNRLFGMIYDIYRFRTEIRFVFHSGR